ncbi:sigma-70 family RNA polymerase sigma factor [Pseudoflavonifractor phocaeensis]|uniref:sigma-70 family RNA polymerase sigma factor n=1 Tax=Pseudoflavonifractor phocaeensis TaxID=1870988 RepID=UPI00195F02B8|nr:sigma-70 family RNA polymerase sigma factor [Pseudoflavonifractor phocaeensis]MBM6886747.1 sigma-70 family RNA polymerase sigma factor [Pseudoflavonifractor phocaeensis]
MMTDQQFMPLAQRYMDTIFRLAFHYTKSQAEADDITQEVLLKLYRTDKQFESEAHVKHWLLRVTINACKKALLSPWRRTEPMEDHTAALPFPSPEHSALMDAVLVLPAKYRVPIYLHYYEDYSCDEVAALLHIPSATVRTRLRRARAILKTDLQEADEHV